MSVDETAVGIRPPETILQGRKPGELYRGEIIWRDNQKWLQESGYALRPRYQPDWVPSWQGTSKDWSKCEDGLGAIISHLVDATRVSDGSQVMLKLISKKSHPHEVEVSEFLSSAPLVSSPRNHSMRLFEVLQIPNAEDLLILVLPFLRPFDNPPFDTIGESVDYFSQVFEGLQNLHEHDVAHRDCGATNIMMDATSLYPDLYHPAKIDRSHDLSGPARHFTRTQRPPRYFFVDFGISRRYPPGQRPAREDIILPGDKSVPEHQGDAEECDPFPTDIYLLGNMIRERFLNTHYGYGFIRPLIENMVQDDPSKRPTINEVVARFTEIRASLGSWTLRSRPVGRREFFLAVLWRYIPHWKRRIGYMMRRIPPIPSYQH